MKKIILLSLLSIICLTGSSQIINETLRDYFADAEFFLEEEEYVDALYDYLEIYNQGFEDNANINYRIGICYLNIPGQKEKSIPYLQKATENTTTRYRESVLRETRAPLDVYLYLGNAYRVIGQLDKAIYTYNQYIDLAGDSDQAGKQYANQQITSCTIARGFMENPVNVRKTNLGPVINTNSSNFKAVVSGDGNVLLYMMELPFYDAVYFSEKADGSWSEPVNITSQIQSDGDQYICDVSYDGTELYLTKEDNFNSDIYKSTYENGLWSKSRPLNNNINTKFWESHASISKDGNTLYFTSNRSGGAGEMDIYKSGKDPLGGWGPAVLLGAKVNTMLNEDTPFITEDGTRLYFSSQSHNNMGGYDIFMVTRQPDGRWSEPVNMGYPINTTDDDLFFYPWKNGEVAYVSLYSDEGYGKEDIYKLSFVPGEMPDETIAMEITGEPAEEETGEPTADTVEITQISEDELPVEEEAEPVRIVLELRPVYFAFDDAKVTGENKILLDKLVSFLEQFEDAELLITGHTDAIGTKEYNMKLSERRARAVLKYIVGQEIDISRIEIQARGEEEFAAINKNPDGSDNPRGRKFNRRADFEISGIDDKESIIIKKAPVPEELRFKKEQ